MVYSSMERELVKMSYYYSYGVQQHGEGACEDELLL